MRLLPDVELLRLVLVAALLALLDVVPALVLAAAGSVRFTVDSLPPGVVVLMRVSEDPDFLTLLLTVVRLPDVEAGAEVVVVRLPDAELLVVAVLVLPVRLPDVVVVLPVRLVLEADVEVVVVRLPEVDVVLPVEAGAAVDGLRLFVVALVVLPDVAVEGAVRLLVTVVDVPAVRNSLALALSALRTVNERSGYFWL